MLRLALALLFAAPPAVLHAQDTARAPAATAPRVNLPAGTQVTRPPLSAPATVARPPAATQEPTQQLVTVPDVGGRTVDEARRLLAAAGLVVGPVAEGQGSGTPGTIVQQQPRAGSVVAPKSDVRLWLAPRAVATAPPPVTRPPAQEPARPSLVTVPRLAGRTVDDARATLARVSLVVGDVGEAAGTGAPGTIVRQSPRPGFPVTRGSAVQVWVVPARVAQQPPRETPSAPLLVRVPSVTGQTADRARETLAAAGLALGETAEAPGTGAPGTVVRQQPAAGSAMLPNSRVRVWLAPARRVPPAQGGQVATRPDPPRPARPPAQRPPLTQNPVVTVPVGGDSATVSMVTVPVGIDSATPSTVRVPVGADSAAVSVVTVPVGADSATVPDVRRLPLGEARASLEAAGYTAVVDAALADSAGWVVSAQQPGPGARLAPGGRVALLLDPPSAATAAQPPGAAGPTRPAEGGGGISKLWILLAVVLLIAAAAAGAQRMRARKRVLPVAGVSARLRMDTPARVAVEGAPFGEARLRFRMNPGRTAARVAAAGPLFVRKEVAGD
jgi:beta-lactam-binding protein with PASTA domain